MSAAVQVHAATCRLCAAALQQLRPYDPGGCQWDIRPGDGWNDAPVIQCPHPAVPGGELCLHHFAGVCDGIRRQFEDAVAQLEALANTGVT